MKSLRRHRLTTAVHVSLLLSMPAIAFAQDATTDSTDQARTLDTIEVTGSRIKQTDKVTSAPVQVITREQIDELAGKAWRCLDLTYARCRDEGRL